MSNLADRKGDAINYWALLSRTNLQLGDVDDQKIRIARWLAKQHRENVADLQDVYWFPDNSKKLADFEVRLLETGLEEELKHGKQDDEIFTLSFKETSFFPFNSSVAVILPDEYCKRKLPENWGNWNDAVPLEV